MSLAADETKVTFIVTEEQKRRLFALAKKRGMNASNYIRGKLFEEMDKDNAA